MTWDRANNVTASSATTGEAIVIMPAVLTAQALVRVGPAGQPADGDVSDVPFALVAPTVTMVMPTATDSWQIGTMHEIQWRGILGDGNIAPASFAFSVQVSSDGGVTWQTARSA